MLQCVPQGLVANDRHEAVHAPVSSEPHVLQPPAPQRSLLWSGGAVVPLQAHTVVSVRSLWGLEGPTDRAEPLLRLHP
eukprot:4756004-Amphidinium_carterae.1